MISITEVSERTGLRPSALRYYEEVGLITSPARQGGRRLYPDSVLERLRLIAAVQSCGFTIAEIRELLVEDGCTPERWKPLAQRKLAEVGALIEKAKLTRRLLEESLDCECRALENCVLITGRPEAGHTSKAGQRSVAVGHQRPTVNPGRRGERLRSGGAA